MNLISTSRARQIDTVINAPTTSTFTIPSTTVVVTSAICPHWINIGANPVLNTATNFIIPTNATFEFSCANGDKIVVGGHAAGGHVGVAY